VLVFGPNLLLALGPHFKLIAEIDAATADLSGLAGFAALRMHGWRWAVDLGAARIDGDLGPLLSLTWRPDLTAARRARGTTAPAYVPPALRR
jgi:hypothetical protein